MHFPLIWMQILICGFLDSCFVLFIMFCALCMLYPQRLSPLCRETLNDIMTRGHSRVPVYAEKPTNIIGLVLVIHFFLLLRYFFWIIDINDSTHTHTHTHIYFISLFHAQMIVSPSRWWKLFIEAFLFYLYFYSNMLDVCLYFNES